jgi:hypothetical protein
MKNIKEEILLQLEKPMNDITIRIIESEKAIYLKKTGKELIITPRIEEMIRLSLVIDLMKALQNYILPTDELEQMNWYEGVKGIEIHARINRSGETHHFMTEAITAGGYNIQRFHYRYITKTKMPRVMSDLAREYVEKQKRLNKVEKMETELNRLKERLEEVQTKWNHYSSLNKEGWIETMKEDKMYGWRYNHWVKDGDEEFLEESIQDMKRWHIELPKYDLKSLPKAIAKLEAKLQPLK